VLHKLSFITFEISCPCKNSKKIKKNVVGPLNFGGYIVNGTTTYTKTRCFALSISIQETF
jgi:hypothetical protein